MAVSQTRQEAERNKMPPELRNWLRKSVLVQSSCTVRRFAAQNEQSGNRGWMVYCHAIDLNGLPDGYRFGHASDRSEDGLMSVQIKEE